MSDVQETTKPTVEATEPTTTAATQQPETTAAATTTEEAPQVEQAPKTDALAAEEQKPEIDGAADETKDAAAAGPLAGETEAAAEKTAEPITEGQLAYKGPGLLKSLVPSKKEFWLSDSPVTPQHMDMYMRGEKPEISNPVVAWASQTGKGLLFFNKKSETDRTRPASVLPLYDAVDLKKSHPHEIIFKIAGHQHTLKAADDAERDGWYMSLERAVEMGKADKETIRSSEGYKAEMEKLNKPNTMSNGVGGGAAAARARSQPKKSVDANKAEEAKRAGSDQDDEAVKKNQKSRSTSRGMLNRLKAKKDEMEDKREEKKEEKDEKKAEKEETPAEKKEEEAGEGAAAAAGVGGIAALDAHGTAERAVGAPVEEAQEPVAESTSAAKPTTEEPVKQPKRGSIFGRMQSGWGSMKSPSKEKTEKESELKPEVPPKDTAVSETAPQIPEPSTTEPTTDSAVAAPAAAEATAPTNETKPAEDAVSPQQQKGGFLSNLLNKRGRSVSPSANMKEAPAKKEEAAPVPAKDEPVAAAAEEPITGATEESKPATETPAAATEAAEEPAKTDATSPATGNKRQSVITNLGRRASRAFKGFNTPAKKENAAPAATETKKAEEVGPEAESKPAVNGETTAPESTTAEPQQQQQNSIGDVVPEAVNIGQAQSTPTVTASA